MTTLSIRETWRAQSRRDEGTTAQQVRAVVLALVLSYGLVLAARLHLAFPFYLSLAWAVMPWLANATKVARLTVALAAAALACGFGLLGSWELITMFD